MTIPKTQHLHDLKRWARRAWADGYRFWARASRGGIWIDHTPDDWSVVYWMSARHGVELYDAFAVSEPAREVTQ